MTQRQSTIRLSIEDDFSAPLEAYAAGMAQADEATAAAAAGAEVSAAATDKVAASAEAAAVSQEFLGQAGQALTEDQMAAAASMNEFATADQAAAEAAAAAAAAEDVQAESAGAMATANSVATSGMMVLAGAGIAVAGAMGIAKAAYNDTIGAAIALDDQVRKLSLDIGATPEQASKLIYAANVTGVSVDALSRSLDQAINKLRSTHSDGIEPTVDGLGKLSDAYLKLAPGVDRTQFLLDNFGRSGAQIAPLMALGSAGIKALGDQAQLTGNVLSTQVANQLHTLDVQTNQLTTDSQGLGVALGGTLAPAATRVVDGGLNLVHTLDLVNAAQQDGIITAFGQAVALGQIALGGKGLKTVYDELAPQVEQVNYDLEHGADASDRATKRTQDATASVLDNKTAYSDAASIIAEYTGDVNLQAQSQYDAAQATAAYNQQLADQQAAIQQGLANAAMSSVITDAQQHYHDAVKSSQPDIEKLTKQIAAMEAANGQEMTTVVKGTVSQEDYNLAVARAQLAQDKYQTALAGTVDKHGKLQQASGLTLEGMRIAAESAQNQVDKLSQKMGSATTGVADYSTAIADAKSKLADLQQKEADAEDQIRKTTGQFILQNLALDMGKNLTPEMALQMEKALGLVNDKEYTLAQTVLGATKLWDLNKNGVIDAGVEYNSLTKYLADQQAQVVASDGVVPPLTGHVEDLGGAAHHAGDEINILGDSIDALHDKVVTVTVNTLYGTGGPGYEPPPGGGSAGGGTTSSGGGAWTPPGANGVVVPPRSNNGGGAGGSSTHSVNVNIGNVHLGPGTSTAAAQAFGASLGASVRNQVMAGSASLGN